jgi:Fic family protein
MNTLKSWSQSPPQVPLYTVWELNELAEFRGKQELYTRQSPERLKQLREHAIIESSVASNRIEGVEVEPERVKPVVLGKTKLIDRNEIEVRGYQSALRWIHRDYEKVPFSLKTVLELHRLTRPDTWDSGRLKTEDGEIIEKHADGRTTVRFLPLAAAATPSGMEETCGLYAELLRDKTVPPLVLWAAANLDFLCIHPFRDGNGRVSRLLLLLTLYQLGFQGGRYISLEAIIERSKERYYETLRQSSQGWHEGAHDPWPYINYLLYTLKELYQEFSSRYEQTAVPRGAKTAAVLEALQRIDSPFHIKELWKLCPEVSLDMVRTVLKSEADSGRVTCMGRGKKAQWRRNR